MSNSSTEEEAKNTQPLLVLDETSKPSSSDPDWYHEDASKGRTCSICANLFLDPQMILKCQHQFCKACLNGLSPPYACPLCRNAFDKSKDIIPAMALSREISSMVMTCKFCKAFRGTEKEMVRHWESVCAPCKCRQCEKTFQAVIEFDKHSCECKHCNGVFKTKEEILKHDRFCAAKEEFCEICEMKHSAMQTGQEPYSWRHLHFMEGRIKDLVDETRGNVQRIDNQFGQLRQVQQIVEELLTRLDRLEKETRTSTVSEGKKDKGIPERYKSIKITPNEFDRIRATHKGHFVVGAKLWDTSQLRNGDIISGPSSPVSGNIESVLYVISNTTKDGVFLERISAFDKKAEPRWYDRTDKRLTPAFLHSKAAPIHPDAMKDYEFLEECGAMKNGKKFGDHHVQYEKSVFHTHGGWTCCGLQSRDRRCSKKT